MSQTQRKLKRIDETYCWKFPTIVVRHAELLELLKTKPLYVDALYTRKLLLKRMEWDAKCRQLNEGQMKRPKLSLADLKEPALHLALFK